jgi:TRAP-type mannitol/chloroaromatic compound transport system permease small subunit
MKIQPLLAAHAAFSTITTGASLLVLPLSLLLFAQWPLRDVWGSGARPANDAAQWVFALYVAVAIRYATARRTHFTADFFARRYSQRVRTWLGQIGHGLAVLPFALFVIVKGAPFVWRSLQSLESFPDTSNPGYFLVKLAAWLLAFLMATEAMLNLFSSSQSDTRTQVLH